jgi:histidinol-phosphate/aromatic aminotransferase/cobyric acid decarboxylase-like protein
LDKRLNVYLHFVEASKRYFMSTMINSHPVFVLNSLSKLFGIPAVRLGWGIAQEDLVESFSKFESPLKRSALSRERELIQDRRSQDEMRNLAVTRREDLYRRLQKIRALTTFPSETTFLLAGLPPRPDLVGDLHQAGR